QGAGQRRLGRGLRRPAPRGQRLLRPHGGGLRRRDRQARALRGRHGRAPDGHPRRDRDGPRGRVAIGPHHLVEVAGVLVFGVLFYSYTYRWFEPGTPGNGRRRALLNGAAFGGLAVVLITARVETPEGIDLDAHTVPLALITLFEGWPTALVATTLPAAYRVWLGGNDAWASLLSLGAAAAAGSLAHVWARRDGGVRPRHALTLSLVVFVTTFASFALLGPRGLTLVERAWLPLLAISVVGTGVVARLFGDVVERAEAVDHHGRRYEIVIYRESVEREAAETAQREAADLRAVALLASAAAHEINNPLTVVVGSLELLARHLGSDQQERRWLDRANAAAQRIRDIVARMTRITRIERTDARPGLPPMLDIHRS